MQKKHALVALCILKSLYLTKEGITVLSVHIPNKKSFRMIQTLAYQLNVCTYGTGDIYL